MDLRPTPYSVYCHARAVTSSGREYPTAMCNGDTKLLFAAMVGIEDGLRFLEASKRGQVHSIPTRKEFDAVVEAAFGD